MIFPKRTQAVGDCIAKIRTDRWGNEHGPYIKDSYPGSNLFEGEKWPSHRLSYYLNVAEIPLRPPKDRKSGLVLHTCDNKWCINPEHLYLGSAKENAIDNAERNHEWRRNRSEAQKKLGAPKVSKEGRKRMAEANRNRMIEVWSRPENKGKNVKKEKLIQ